MPERVVNIGSKILFWMVLLFVLTGSGPLKSQITVFIDDFNRATVTPGGIPAMNYTITNTSSGTNLPSIDAALTTGTVPYLKIPNNSPAGRSYVMGSLSTFSSPFNPTLNANTGIVEWTFNLRHNRGGGTVTTLGGFGSAAYGIACILVSSHPDPMNSACSGYAVVMGAPASGSDYRLVKFTNGLTSNSNVTTVISPGISLGNLRDWVSVRVTYDPLGNMWTLYERLDSPSATALWNDPAVSVPAYTTVGSTADNTYTGVAMTGFGYFWNYSTSSGVNAFFDNYKVTVTPTVVPSISVDPTALTGFNYVFGSGPSGSQDFNISGLNLDGSNGSKLVITAPADYTVSLDDNIYAAVVEIPYTGGTLVSTPVYVRLAGGLTVGDYNGENVVVSGGGAPAANVTCNGSVLPLPVSYTWTGAISGDWTVAGNWSPERTTPMVNDIMQFSDGGVHTITGIPAQTIGQLLISGGSMITLQAAGSNTVTIAGGTGADLTVSGGEAQLNVSGTNVFTILLASGATGQVNGTVNVSGAGHQLRATDAGSLIFTSGSTCKTTTGFTGNVFGTTALNSVSFQSGSVFIQDAGSNPFGAGQPASVVVFEPGSLFRFTAAAGGPSYSGRTYANFEFDAPNRKNNNQGSSPFTCDNLTITNGTLEFDFTGGLNIKGDVTVNDTLTIGNWTKVTNVTLNGSAAQTIGGTGVLTFGINGFLNVSNPAGAEVASSCLMNGLSVSAGSTISLHPGVILSLTGNLASGAASPINAGSGSFHFLGTSAQSITGSFVFENLTINNSAGLTLAGNNRVNGTLAMSSGLLTIGDFNLLLGPSATISGSLSEAAMIVASASGELRKEFAPGFTGSFVFPVGDHSGTPGFSPVTMEFLSGSFAPDNYVGVNLSDIKHPLDPNTGSYLNRYWNLSGNGVTDFISNVAFDYLPGDVVGTESLIRCIRLLPAPAVTYDPANIAIHRLTATGLTSFSTFIGSQPLPALFAVGGGGNYCSGGAGAVVTLGGSETDASYQLFKDGVAEGAAVAGTGAGLAWNNQTAGSYTVVASNTAGTLQMTGSAVITAMSLPDGAGAITGPAAVTQGQSGVVYSVDPAANAAGYAWTLPSGASITSGDNTASITVAFSASAVSGVIKVHGTNLCGNGADSPDFLVTVESAIPINLSISDVTVAYGQVNCYNAQETITVAGEGTFFTIENGGQATIIAGQKILFLPGATVQAGGILYAYITQTSTYCTPGPAQAKSLSAVPGDGGATHASYLVYPNPTTGEFTLEVTGEPAGSQATAEIFGMRGETISEVTLDGKLKQVFNLHGSPAGIYFLRIVRGSSVTTIKVIRQ